MIISLIIPCRNEKSFISKCLDSIIEQDFPKDDLEVFLVDGMSTDGTRKIIEEYAKRYKYIRVLDNPNKTTPFAMNMGIKQAKGGVIMKMDAHTIYDKEYIKNCLWYMQKYSADNVGGILITMPQSDSIIAKAIAFSISSPFGVGNSYFRTGCSEVKWTDTVAFGCYKKEVFEKIGLYNENLSRGQDMELNLRLKKAGGKTLLFPKTAGYYYPKGRFGDFLRHNFRDGIWATYTFRFAKIPLNLRHYIPLLFVLAIAGLLPLGIFLKPFLYLFLAVSSLYVLLAVYFSLPFIIKEKNIRLMVLMPIAFFIRHAGYGLGSLFGIIKLIFNIKK